jgi:hypothetical protein
MFNNVLIRSNSRLSSLPCCKQDGTQCDCVSCMNADFTSRADSYDCEKKMSTYVLKYGAAYASEIYHYLVASNFASKVDKSRPLNVISVGCGFSPDYFALRKYFQVNSINVPINYTGVDKSKCWDSVRPYSAECRYIPADITEPFTMKSPDVVVVSKVFSTLYRNNAAAADKFLKNLEKVAFKNFLEKTILIFIDVNHIDFGRDVFHKKVSSFLSTNSQYYFDGYNERSWVHIKDEDIVFDIPDGLSGIQPHHIGKTVVFEYSK